VDKMSQSNTEVNHQNKNDEEDPLLVTDLPRSLSSDLIEQIPEEVQEAILQLIDVCQA